MEERRRVRELIVNTTAGKISRFKISAYCKAIDMYTVKFDGSASGQARKENMILDGQIARSLLPGEGAR
tara:strand:+ start:5256 stop:5462 length:207 start_codon:yes stop_codon:yes gene_type:complete